MNEDKLTKLERLAELKAKGAITAKEYEHEKSMLLTEPRPAVKEPQQGLTKPMLIWLGIFLVLVALVFINDSLTNKADDSPVDTEQRRHQYDADISHIKAARVIKNGLKDPYSYEEVSHKGWYAGANGVYVSCLIEYRAKNSFGAYELERARVDFDTQMQVIGVIPVE